MVRAAVIGAGYIAREHMACLERLESAELVAVCDLSPAMAEAMAERFKVERHFTDHRRMLEEMRPDVVHITTPTPSHVPLATDALEADAHALVEKPITMRFDDVLGLRDLAERRQRMLIEDYNYLFNSSVQTILAHQQRGELGEVVHVDVTLNVNILGKGSRFTDRSSPHPALRLPGGAIGDFLTHLSYLACAFIGPHRAVRSVWQKRAADSPLPSDEFRALVEGEHATALLSFSSHAQPDRFHLCVHGTKMRATASLFEPLLAIEKLRRGPRPLMPVINGLSVAGAWRRHAFAGLWRKLAGRPVAYEGLWELLRRVYAAAENRQPSPVTPQQIEMVNRLVADLTREENRL